MAIRNPFVRSPYNYDMNVAGDESGLKCLDPSLAVQASKDEVDINTIVRRFGLTGQLPEDVRAPVYGDFTEVVDYQTALNAVIAADASFMEMPADVRTRFGNDPQAFVEFCSDPKNVDEMRKLGLLVPEAPKPSPVAVTLSDDQLNRLVPNPAHTGRIDPSWRSFRSDDGQNDPPLRK